MKRADVAVYGSDGRLQLVVEIKARPGASTEWAVHMRRNLLAHAAIPLAPYFLLALPNFFYLWKDAASANHEARPDYRIKASEMLASYLDQTIPSLDELSGYGLELIVTSWLEDVVHAELRRDTISPNLQWLLDSGLYESVRGGSIAIEVAI